MSRALALGKLAGELERGIDADGALLRKSALSNGRLAPAVVRYLAKIGVSPSVAVAFLGSRRARSVLTPQANDLVGGSLGAPPLPEPRLPLTEVENLAEVFNWFNLNESPFEGVIDAVQFDFGAEDQLLTVGGSFSSVDGTGERPVYNGLAFGVVLINEDSANTEWVTSNVNMAPGSRVRSIELFSEDPRLHIFGDFSMTVDGTTYTNAVVLDYEVVHDEEVGPTVRVFDVRQLLVSGPVSTVTTQSSPNNEWLVVATPTTVHRFDATQTEPSEGHDGIAALLSVPVHGATSACDFGLEILYTTVLNGQTRVHLHQPEMEVSDEILVSVEDPEARLVGGVDNRIYVSQRSVTTALVGAFTSATAGNESIEAACVLRITNTVEQSSDRLGVLSYGVLFPQLRSGRVYGSTPFLSSIFGNFTMMDFESENDIEFVGAALAFYEENTWILFPWCTSTGVITAAAGTFPLVVGGNPDVTGVSGTPVNSMAVINVADLEGMF